MNKTSFEKFFKECLEGTKRFKIFLDPGTVCFLTIRNVIHICGTYVVIEQAGETIINYKDIRKIEMY